MVPGKGELWLPTSKFELFAWACESKGQWWVEQNNEKTGPRIIRVAVQFTDVEEVVLKTFFNTIVDGVISMKQTGIFQLSHANVMYATKHSARGNLSCTGLGLMSCGVYCEATAVLDKMRIRVVSTNSAKHAVHNTTPLPTLGYTEVNAAEFDGKCAKIKINPNDSLPICTLNPNGTVLTPDGRVFKKKNDKTNPNSRRYMHYVSALQKYVYANLLD